MSTKEELEPYMNREHALVKHKLFERYLKSFIMIIGRTRTNLSYIDAFAGPWKSAEPDFSDTSFGRSVDAIEGCSVRLARQTGRRPKFRSLFIESEDEAYQKLDAYANQISKPTATAEAWHAKFQDSVQLIADWIKPNEKAFVLIDPKAYNGLISPSVLAPLLKNPNVEVLINYMWHFITLAIGHTKTNQKHRENMIDLYGDDYEMLASLPIGEKERALVLEYAKRLQKVAGNSDEQRLLVGRFPVEYAFRNGTKYYMVYATHSPRGLVAFSEASEKSLKDQYEIKFIASQQRREQVSSMSDLFDGHVPERITKDDGLEQPWIELLPSPRSEATIDVTVWSKMLEDCDCLPSQLQKGLGGLIKQGLVEVVGASSRRTTNFVHWKNSEVVRRLK